VSDKNGIAFVFVKLSKAFIGDFHIGESIAVFEIKGWGTEDRHTGVLLLC
jgi:hypothetical protein